ncbi:MAG: DUF2442 domain-containing protein [Calditrichaeota bacterium]|nr:DUF2442 domain-containing protein [Calditrichota bacterium]MCB0304973.1 DUF2442 domain-containing protein [Calditrichota bacterium]MCB9088468.1 DUF2442 domain-containing protein [Calditrichia bacterium]
MFLHITNARYQSNYKIWLQFNNGTEGIVDLQDECSGEIFEPLQDMNFFKSFILDKELGTIRWPNGADFAPEFLKDLLLNADQQVQSESV